MFIKININFTRYIPKHRIQYKVWWLVTSQPFEYAIFVLIMINTITLAMKYHNQPDDYSKALDLLNMVFTAVFALEFIFKLAAFRFKVGILVSLNKRVLLFRIDECLGRYMSSLTQNLSYLQSLKETSFTIYYLDHYSGCLE